MAQGTDRLMQARCYVDGKRLEQYSGSGTGPGGAFVTSFSFDFNASIWTDSQHLLCW